MQGQITEDAAKKAIQVVNGFFGKLKAEDKALLPNVFSSPSTWMAIWDDIVLAIFLLNKAAQERVSEYQRNGWSPFPGFIVSENSKPAGAPVAIAASGSCNYFASNRTTNMIAFCVKPGASFTVVDHFHEVKDSSTGQIFEYHVDLTFVLGIHQEEQWADVERRLSELLAHTLSVWGNL